MQDSSFAEYESLVGAIKEKPPVANSESFSTATYPQMEEEGRRATPLNGTNPGAKNAQKQFEQMIHEEAVKNNKERTSLAENLFNKAGVQTELSQNAPQKVKKSLLARFWEWLKNLFR